MENTTKKAPKIYLPATRTIPILFLTFVKPRKLLGAYGQNRWRGGKQTTRGRLHIYFRLWWAARVSHGATAQHFTIVYYPDPDKGLPRAHALSASDTYGIYSYWRHPRLLFTSLFVVGIIPNMRHSSTHYMWHSRQTQIGALCSKQPVHRTLYGRSRMAFQEKKFPFLVMTVERSNRDQMLRLYIAQRFLGW